MPGLSISDCETIDKFLTRSRQIDKFEKCQTIYDLFGIKDRNAPYSDIEKQLNAFGTKYSRSTAPKFAVFSKTVLKDVEVVKRVLKDHRREYNDYLKTNDPRVKQLRLHFDFCTKLR